MAVASLLVLSGVAGFSLIEYAHHRWGGHTSKLGARLLASHKAHHRDPTEGGVSYPTKLRQRAPLVALASGAIGAPLGLLIGPSAAWVMAGLLGGYAYSEWFHHRMHQRQPRSSLERWLWRHHYIHHFSDVSVNYGFTSPLWDWAFGTARMDDVVEVPETLVPPWHEPIPEIRLRRRRADAAV